MKTYTYAMHERTTTGIYETEYVVTASDGERTGIIGIFPTRERAEYIVAAMQEVGR